MSPRVSTPDIPKASGLIPAALLGLLGLPLIVAAGPSSSLPLWSYAAGLPAGILLGGMTLMRTRRTERYAALVATVLLASLCVVQLTLFHSRRPGPHETLPARDARLPKADMNPTSRTEKNVTPTSKENR